jgi:peptidase M28-like protein
VRPFKIFLVALEFAANMLHAQAFERLDSATAINEAHLYKNLSVLSADSMEGRMAGSPGGERARGFLVREITRIGLQPLGKSYTMRFSALSQFATALTTPPPRRVQGTPNMSAPVRTRPTIFGENVVGVVRGTVHPDRYIVVSAHYDHLGMRNGEIYHGADDNASGSAGILALAEYTMAHPPLNSVIFVWFDGEEEGLLGSEDFVRSPPVAIDKIIVDMNLDMIGRSVHGDLNIVGARNYPVMQPFIDTIASIGLVNVHQGYEGANGDTLPDLTYRSDQGPFAKRKIPFIFLNNDEHADYHRPTDEAIRINAGFYARSTQTASMMLRMLDGSLDAIEAVRRRR